MPTEPDTAAVIDDIARGRACWQSGHERQIQQLTADLDREREGRQRAMHAASAAQSALTTIATALGLPTPVDAFNTTKVDIMPILDRLAKPTADGTGAKAAPKNPAEAIQESLKNLDPEAIQAQLKEAFGPVKAFFDDIRAAGERLQEKNRQGRD